MSLKNKKSVIVTFVLGSLCLFALGGYLIAKEYAHIENNQNVKLENKLMIGTYYQSQSMDKVTSFNTLYIEVYNNAECVQKLKYTTENPLLIKDKNYPNCVFYDLSEVMSEYIDGLGIYYWGKSNPNKNYIRVHTEFNYAPFLSSEIKISDCGIYLVNVPIKNGGVVQVEHAYIYQRNIVGW